MIGLLTHLSTALGRSEAESAALLNAFVREAQQLARTYGEATYPGLGTFRMGPSGVLEFRPDASLSLVVNHRFAGLTPVPVQPPATPDGTFAPVWPAGTPQAAQASQSGWMTPPASLDRVGMANPTADGGGYAAPTTSPVGAAYGGGYDAFTTPTAPPVSSGYAPPPAAPPVAPPPDALPPIGAYTATPIVEPYTAPKYTAHAPPVAATYTPPAYPPYLVAPVAASAHVPPPDTPDPYQASAFTAEPSSDPLADTTPRTDRAPSQGRPWMGLATLALLATLGLIAWYGWATGPQPSVPVAGTPPATIVSPADPAFALPPPDSIPPDASGSAPPDTVAVPAPTLPVDPGASAADPAAAAPVTPAPVAAAQVAPDPVAPAPAISGPAPAASPAAPAAAPAVRRAPSPYTTYTGSSRPDRTVRRSPPRRTYTGRTYRSSGASLRPAATTPAVQAAPLPASLAPRPTSAPASTEVGLTPELEAMLLGEEMVQPGAGYSIVVKGEPTEDAARLVAERYRLVGYRVAVLPGVTRDGQPIFRVVVGQFDTLAQVQRALRTLAGDAFPADAWLLPLVP